MLKKYVFFISLTILYQKALQYARLFALLNDENSMNFIELCISFVVLFDIINAFISVIIYDILKVINNERSGNLTTDYERLYFYEQLDNNGNITIRLPQQLKDDFIRCTGGSRQMGRVLREFMVNYIAEREKKK